MKRTLNRTACNGARLNFSRVNFTLLNVCKDSGKSGASAVQDTYVLRNAVLLSDGTPLLASDGTPVTYKEAM